MLMLLALIVLLAGCVDTSREPITTKDELPSVYRVEMWSAHEFYEFGEPVNLRATLTNISTGMITFRGKNDVTPVLDVNVRAADWPGHEEKIWSKENPASVKYQITLAPQESYIITWTLTLSFKTSYVVDMLWIDPREGEQFRGGPEFSYGERLPNP